MVMGENDVKKILGSNLRFLRESCRASQRDICIVLEISPQTYSGWENGRHTPSLDYLLLFSRFYSVSVDSLLTVRSCKVRPVRLSNKSKQVK